MVLKFFSFRFLTISKFIFLLLISWACVTNQESEVQSKDNFTDKRYQNGKLQGEFSMKDGKENGIGKIYYPNGKLSSSCNYVNGKKEGLEKKFYYDGSLYRTREYKHDVLQGEERRYYENGQLKTVLQYKDGMPGTGLKEYTEKGALIDNYPLLEYKIVKNRDFERQKLVLFYFSDTHTGVKYYRGSLLDGGYYDNNHMLCSNNKGVGEVSVASYFEGDITISAKYITANRAPYIIEKTFTIK